MHNMIIKILNENEMNPIILRKLFNLEKIPFYYATMHNIKLQQLPKRDEKRMLIQAEFLLILRKHIPFKCKFIFVSLIDFSI